MTNSPEPPSAELSFVRLAEVAESSTARVDLCRVVAGPNEGALVAVKRLQDDVADDPQFVRMFRDEVWMASALHHENVVRVLGWGEDGEGHYFATEFVRGVSVARLLRTVNQTGEVFTERLIVYLASCICKGLAAAHSLRAPSGELLNLVHRDLTPDNVLVSFQGEVKIADFGMAKAKRRSSMTMAGMVKGTCGYMAPEQVTGKPMDGRVDIFALGVMLFELFCGQRPFRGRNARDTMRRILDRSPPDLTVLRPGIHSVLVSVVQRCLAKEPSDRFQSAVELDQQLTQWLQSHGYHENQEHLARFVRRNAMRQMRWCDRAIAGHFTDGTGKGPPTPSPWAEDGRPGSESHPAEPEVEVGETKTRVEVPKPHSSTEPEVAAGAEEEAPDTRPDEPPLVETSEAPTLIQHPEHAAELLPPSPPAPEFQEKTDSSATLPSARDREPVRIPTSGTEPPSPSRPPPAPPVLPPSRPPPPAVPPSHPPSAPASHPPPSPASKPPPPPPHRRASVRPPPVEQPGTVPRASVSAPRVAPGKAGAAVQKKAREVIQEATRLASQAERAAAVARRAAERAREAADKASAAAERAETAAAAASLAQEALELVKSSDTESARDHIEQAEQLRKSLRPPASATPPAGGGTSHDDSESSG